MDNRETNPQEPKADGVREPASLLDSGTPRVCNWPFKFSLEDNRWYVNRAKRTRKAPQDTYEEALM